MERETRLELVTSSLEAMRCDLYSESRSNRFRASDLSYRLRPSSSASVHVARRTSAMSRDIIEKPSDKPLASSRVRRLEADIPPAPLLTRRSRNCPPFRPSREPTDHGLGLVERQPWAVVPAPRQAPPRFPIDDRGRRRGTAIVRTRGPDPLTRPGTPSPMAPRALRRGCAGIASSAPAPGTAGT